MIIIIIIIVVIIIQSYKYCKLYFLGKLLIKFKHSMEKKKKVT